MKRIMCIRLPSWPTDRVKRRRPEWRDRPLALADNINTRATVGAMCDTARAGGVHLGMTLAEATATCRGLVYQAHDPQQNARGLEALARWMMARISPLVAIEGNDSIFVEIGGSERLFGSIPVIARRTVASMRRFRLNAVISVAPTAGCAWALSATNQGMLVNEADVLNLLQPLPTHALRIDPDTSAALHHVGVETIGQLMRLPRASLHARFGQTLLNRIDHATGHLPEPLRWLEHQTPICEQMKFEGVVDSLEAVWAVLEELVRRVVIELSRRGSGARLLRVRFVREKPPALEQTITLSRPSRHPKNLMELLRLATDTLRTREGFTAIELAVPELQKLTTDQTSFTQDEAASTAADLTGWIERIRAKLGNAAITKPRLIESHIPERACEWIQDAEAATAVREWPPHARPLALLPTPVQIGVIVLPTDDREGHPASFTHNGRVHRLRFAIGPERISGTWWTGHNKTRDYFDVEDHAGSRFWVFRVLQTFKWYLHGLFY